jgi:DNA-binding response OmpR family regulator
MLPLGGGMTVLRNLRISTHTNSIPVLVLTGMQDEELKKNILEMGVAFYMQKPYEIEELTKEINRILTERGGKSA